MAQFTRSSVLAIVEEVTEGVPVAPSAATDFVSLQDGFSLEPGFDTIESSEIKSSIAQGKTYQGIEAPKGSVSHYLRHSGVEGSKPDYSLLLKGLFGSTVSNGTQRLTTSSSTTKLLKLASGGSDFPRGSAVLIKDTVNGFSIRPVHSFSTNDLTLGFALSNAPASGVGCGKNVRFIPANSGHPSLTLWEYKANGAAVEMISGARVNEGTFNFSAGELINAEYSLDGLKFHFNPITIASTDTKLDFDDGSTRVATILAGVYRDPIELADALTAAMNAAGSSDTFSVVFNSSGANAGKFTVSTNGMTLSLKWNTGTNTANTVGDKIGFDTSADDTSATTYTSDNALSYTASYTPSYDAADPLIAKYNEVFVGSVDDNIVFDAKTVTLKVSNNLQQQKSVCAQSGVKSHNIQKRSSVVTLSGEMVKHDAEKFKNYRNNDAIRFLYNFGARSGGNWIPGSCGCIYLPNANITSFKCGDDDGVVTFEIEIKGFVDSNGNDEVYLNFL